MTIDSSLDDEQLNNAALQGIYEMKTSEDAATLPLGRAILSVPE